jgi:type II secretory pathway component PulF
MILTLWSLKAVDKKGHEFNLLQEAESAFEAVEKVHNSGLRVVSVTNRN